MRLSMSALVAGLSLMAGLSVGLNTQAQTYTYDDVGRLRSVSYPNGKTVTYTFDKADNRNVKNVANTATPANPACAVSGYFTNTEGPILISPNDIACTQANGHDLVFSKTSSGTLSNGAIVIPGSSSNFSISVNYTVADGYGGRLNGTMTVTYEKIVWCGEVWCIE